MGAGKSQVKSPPNVDSTRQYLQVENLILCAICEKKYDKPRMLRCQHTFCLKCLEFLIKDTNTKGGYSVNCPTCRQSFGEARKLTAMPTADLEKRFPENITVAKILENLPDDTEYCDVHEDKLHEYFCETDRKLCCSACILEHHKRCGNIHQVNEYTNSGPRFETVCRSLLAELKKCIAQTQTISNQLSNNKEKLVKQREKIFKELEDFKKRIVSEIDRNVEALKERINDIVSMKFDELEVMEDLKEKFTEYVGQISSHAQLEPLEKLQTLHMIDRFTQQDSQLLKASKAQFKTIQLEFLINTVKEQLCVKNLQQSVNTLLVSERLVY